GRAGRPAERRRDHAPRVSAEAKAALEIEPDLLLEGVQQLLGRLIAGLLRFVLGAPAARGTALVPEPLFEQAKAFLQQTLFEAASLRQELVNQAALVELHGSVWSAEQAVFLESLELVEQLLHRTGRTGDRGAKGRHPLDEPAFDLLLVLLEELVDLLH